MVQVLGIDIGGTGIKAAPVDVTKGPLEAPRQKLPTPHPATPDAVAGVVAELIKSFAWTGPAGMTFPGVVTQGTIRSAANLDPAWIGVDAVRLFTKEGGLPVTVVNDADAAGIAEMRFGAGAGEQVLAVRCEVDGAREESDLSWGKGAGRVDEYLEHMEALLSPDLIIIGGGISKKSDKFLPLLTDLRARIVPAGMLNDAGIVGAAMAVGTG